MSAGRFHDFGRELKRPCILHDNCYDCAMFYDDCNGWRASRDFACQDCHRLPDVGIDGRTGQEFPPSRQHALAGSLPTIRPGQAGEPRARTCDCGTPLAKGKRLCSSCRTENRRRTLRQYMQTYRKRRCLAVVGSDPDPPFPAQRTHATHHNAGDRAPTGQR